MLNIKKLYIGEIGRFEGYIHGANGTVVDYTKLKSASFYLKKDECYYDIFTGRPYQILKAGEQIPADNVGLVEPQKCSQYFSNKTNSMIENDYMFSIEDLQQIADEMASGELFAGRKIQQILTKRKENELGM